MRTTFHILGGQFPMGLNKWLEMLLTALEEKLFYIEFPEIKIRMYYQYHPDDSGVKIEYNAFNEKWYEIYDEYKLFNTSLLNNNNEYLKSDEFANILFTKFNEWHKQLEQAKIEQSKIEQAKIEQ